jgi:host factor-I protein
MPEELEEPLSSEGEAETEEQEIDESPAPREARGGPPSGPRNNTQQEVAYLRRLIDQNIPVTVKIRGGESVSGIIEYYDTSFIRLTRQGQANLFIFKKDILYLREDTPLADAAPVETAAS